MTHSMMCGSVVDLVEALHDGELTIEEQVQVERHLEVCAACHSTARELREVHDLVGVGIDARAPRDEERLSRDLDTMSQAVISRVRSEREASWPVQVARAFEDLHFVYAGLGAMSATASCVLTIAALLHFAPAQRDDSLSGVLAALAQPGSNRNPVSLDERMELPRFDDENVGVLEALPDVAAPQTSALAVAGVLTQEGRVAQAEILPAREDDELERRVMQAVSATRFRPAQRHGAPVAVNLIWLFEQTTVHGKSGKI
jgi:TonB family protein